jgi:hypothetical protein
MLMRQASVFSLLVVLVAHGCDDAAPSENDGVDAGSLEAGAPESPLDGLDVGDASPDASATLALIDERAVFGSFEFADETAGCSPPPLGCTDYLNVTWDGRATGGRNFRSYQAQLTTEELDSLVRSAINDEVLKVLLTDPLCGSGVSSWVKIGVGPRLLLDRNLTGCNQPPVVAMVQAAREIIQRISSESNVPVPRPATRTTVVGGRLQVTPRFRVLSRTVSDSDCNGSSCATTTWIEAHARRASVQTESQYRMWEQLSDFEPLASIAVSPAVITALRDDAPCPFKGFAQDQILVLIDSWLYVRSSNLAGCDQAPIIQLRAAIDSFIARLPPPTP